MTSNTVYEVFLALSNEEREKFFILVKEHQKTITTNFKLSKSKIQFSKEEAIKYLLKNVFSPKE